MGSHGHWHRRAYDLGEQGIRRGSHLSLGALSAAGAPPYRRVSRPGMVNQSSLLVGASRARGARHSPRREHGAAPDGGLAQLSASSRTSIRRAAGRFSKCRRWSPIASARRFRWAGDGGCRMSAPHRVLEEIARTNQAGSPAVLTIHPWEIDPSPPRVRLPAGLRFAHYFRLAGFADRLKAILGGCVVRSAPRGGRRTWSRAEARLPRVARVRAGSCSSRTVAHADEPTGPSRGVPVVLRSSAAGGRGRRARLAAGLPGGDPRVARSRATPPPCARPTRSSPATRRIT